MDRKIIKLLIIFLMLSIILACNHSEFSTIPIGKGNFQIILKEDGKSELHNIRARSNVPRGVIEEEHYCGSNDDNYSYGLGSRGFTFINLKKEEVIQTLYINQFEAEHQKAFRDLIHACNINKKRGEGRYLFINSDTHQLDKE